MIVNGVAVAVPICQLQGGAVSELLRSFSCGAQGVQEGDLIVKEDREEGQIGSKVYLYYARAYGCVFALVVTPLACFHRDQDYPSACACPQVAPVVHAGRVLELRAEPQHPDELVQLFHFNTKSQVT